MRRTGSNQVQMAVDQNKKWKTASNIRQLKAFDNYKSTQNNEQPLFKKNKELQQVEFRNGNKLVKVEKTPGKLSITSDVQTW